MKLFFSCHVTSVAVIVSSALLIGLNLLIWAFFDTLWVRIPAVLITAGLMLRVLELCPLWRLRYVDAPFYPWMFSLAALLATFVYLTYPSVWGMVCSAVCMALTWLAGAISIACVGFDELD